MKLVTTAEQVRTLREWTIQDDEQERFAYLYCTRTDDNILLARETVLIRDDDCDVQATTAIRPSLDVERERVGECLSDGLVPVLVHSHPFATTPEFSSRDDEIMTALADWLGALYPESALGFAVLGTEGIETAVYRDLGAGTRTHLPVEVRGEWALDQPVEAPSDATTDAALNRDRFDRSIRALSLEGQRRIADASVAVVGAGGLGSMVVTQLARLGVGELILLDPDVVERSNLPRIYGATDDDVGRYKVDVVGEHAVESGDEPTVVGYRDRVQDVPNDVLGGCDVIVSAVDRVSARLHCNEVAVRTLTYLVDGGVSISTDDADRIETERGLIQLVAPGVTGCLDCLGRGDPEQARIERMSETELEAEIERGYVDADIAEPVPAITPLNGIAASAVTRTVTKLLSQHDEPSAYLRFDGVTEELIPISTHPSDDCLTCGEQGQLGAGPSIEFDPAELVSDSGEYSEQVEASDTAIETEATPIRITASTDRASVADGDHSESTPDEPPETASKSSYKQEVTGANQLPDRTEGSSKLKLKMVFATALFGIGYLIGRAMSDRND
jgi:molybdopterin/thiamine biosynthesis adenylyltransferase